MILDAASMKIQVPQDTSGSRLHRGQFNAQILDVGAVQYVWDPGPSTLDALEIGRLLVTDMDTKWYQPTYVHCSWKLLLLQNILE